MGRQVQMCVIFLLRLPQTTESRDSKLQGSESNNKIGSIFHSELRKGGNANVQNFPKIYAQIHL